MDPLSPLAAVATGAAIAAAALMAWWPLRAWQARRTEREFERRNPRNAEGFIVGAEPRLLTGSRAGAVLVLHGFNDSPQAVRSLADALHAAGWTVRVPALPGHARTLDAFARARATDWEGAARDELAALRRAHADVAVCGLSMGGALALLLAAEQPEVRAVVALAPYLHVSRPMSLLLLLAPVTALGPRYFKGGGKRSIHDPAAAAAIIAYRASTPRLLLELLRVTRHAFQVLPQVRQPVLMMQSREDNRIPKPAALRAFDRIGSADKTMDWLRGSGHVITVDYGHAELERRVVDWLGERLA
jgi:carboxylesterase